MYCREREVRNAARKVFESLPDEVILNMATREFDMENSCTCVCGWAFRAGIDRLADSGFGPLAKHLDEKYMSGAFSNGTQQGCSLLYNQASDTDWNTVYYAVTMEDELPVVELEFVKRLDKIVQGA